MLATDGMSHWPCFTYRPFEARFQVVLTWKRIFQVLLFSAEGCVDFSRGLSRQGGVVKGFIPAG